MRLMPKCCDGRTELVQLTEVASKCCSIRPSEGCAEHEVASATMPEIGQKLPFAVHYPIHRLHMQAEIPR